MNRLLRSLETAGAPKHILAGLEALQFQHCSPDRLNRLNHAEQREFLQWCDERQLTLLLSPVCRSGLPTWFTEPATEKAANYELRFQRVKRELFEIAEALDAAGLEFVMLKGLSHAPALTPDARLRAQGDIDLWLKGPSVYRARDLLKSLGYVPLRDSGSRHLPPMGRPSDWAWRGDIFDPEMPISVELHYELWSEQVEHIAVPGLQQFWERRYLRDFDGHKINVLREEDLLGFAALHLLLHLLHGELPLQRAWEVARFLHTRVSHDSFWTSWRNLHALPLRHLETCVLYLVAKWFACDCEPGLQTDVQKLPKMIHSWLETYSLAPLTREWAPNKSEIWLHLAFINARKDKARVLLRRLMPASLPLLIGRALSQPSSSAKLSRFFRQVCSVAARLRQHMVTLFPTLLDGLRWYWLHRS